MDEARNFGAALRRERERHGITLAAIADQTKVSVSILSGLERGDVSRWPAGIFRRAFVRSYATAVGLDAEETLAEFLRLFPDDGGPLKGRRPLVPGTHSLRLGLAERHLPLIEWCRVAAAAIDVGALAGALLFGWGVASWTGAAIAGVVVGLFWHGTATVLWGVSPGSRLFARQLSSVRARPPVVSTATDTPVTELEPARPAGPMLSIVSTPRARSSSRRERRHILRAERGAERDARPH